MPDLANVFFRDIFTHLNGGIGAQVLAANATASGNIQTLGGVAPIGKYLFRLLMLPTASSALTATLKLYTGTVSSTMASFAAGVASKVFGATSAFATMEYVLELDTRNEYFNNLAAGVSGGGVIYVQPVVIIGATTGVTAALDVLGWCVGNDPANNYDTSTVTIVETDLY